MTYWWAQSSASSMAIRHVTVRVVIRPTDSRVRRWVVKRLGCQEEVPGRRAGAAAGGLVPELVPIPGGVFIAGSDGAEREAAYRLDEAAYGHDLTREQRWYEGERPRGGVGVRGFEITRTPITNAQYQAFVRATGHPPPDVDPETWAGYRLNPVHSYRRTRRFAWPDGRPPAGREDHPVVLVAFAQYSGTGLLPQHSKVTSNRLRDIALSSSNPRLSGFSTSPSTTSL